MFTNYINLCHSMIIWTCKKIKQVCGLCVFFFGFKVYSNSHFLLWTLKLIIAYLLIQVCLLCSRILGVWWSFFFCWSWLDGEAFSDEVWRLLFFFFLVGWDISSLCFCVCFVSLLNTFSLNVLLSIYVMGKHNLGFMNGIWFVFQLIISALY